MGKLKYVVSSLILLTVVSACESQDVARLTAGAPAGDLGDPVNPEPSPSPSPTAPPAPAKSLLSAWTSDRSPAYNAAPFTVDLAEIAPNDVDPGPAFQIEYYGDYAASFYFGIYRCISEVWITGTEDNGTLDIRRSNSGNVNINNGYCTPLVGVYSYVALSGGRYRLDRAGQTSIILQ